MTSAVIEPSISMVLPRCDIAFDEIFVLINLMVCKLYPVYTKQLLPDKIFMVLTTLPLRFVTRIQVSLFCFMSMIEKKIWLHGNHQEINIKTSESDNWQGFALTLSLPKSRRQNFHLQIIKKCYVQALSY